MVDRTAIGRNNKSRGKNDERDFLRRLGGTRFAADTGGKLDGVVDGMAIQVKGGPTVASIIMRQAMDQAKAGAADYPGHLPTVGLVDRRSRPNRYWICFELDAFANYHGYGPKEEEI